METIHIVIGANFGDEGKGLVTNYFTKEHKHSNVLNVLYNGGCQRGHTTNNHVFHCFGSGTLSGADTYYTEDFLVDPIAWNIERYQLGIKGKIKVDGNCRVVTPYDTAINQLIETKRGNACHGSCGMGIYETILRSKTHPIYFDDFSDSLILWEKLQKIYHEYLPKRLKELGLAAMPAISSLDNFITAAHFMYDCCKQVTGVPYAHTYIFEGGQGLLLDEDNTEYFPNLTPSHPGSNNVIKNLKKNGFLNLSKCDINIHYIMRPYMTRHGAGKFETECKKEDINPCIVDKTNQPNTYQGTLRFGYLDMPLMAKAIKKDFALWKNIPNVKPNICITQTNYSDNKIIIGENKTISIPEFHNKMKELTDIDFTAPLTFNTELI